MLAKSYPDNDTFYNDSAALLYGNAKVGIFATLFASSVLVFGFNTPEIQAQKQLWWAIISLLMMYRLLDVYYWHKSEKNQQYSGKKAIARFVTGTLITSLMWCIYCLYVSQYATSAELAAMIIGVSALVGGAATILAAHKFTAMTYAFIMLGPFSVGLLLSAEQYKLMLGLLGVAFSFAMILSAKKSADFMSKVIRLKNENAELILQMEQKVAQRTEKIYQLSNIDPLTGLYNRTAFLQQLQAQLNRSVKNGNTIALLFIDLDGFKEINDTLGHETGDKVLKNTAERLHNICDDQHLLCRWGGDEFIIAFEATDEALTAAYAAKVIDEVSPYYQLENNKLTVGATIGIALYPQHTKKAHELIQLADTAMYAQKKSSPGSVAIFNTEMGQRIFRESQLKRGLAEAIEKQQLRMVYQPIVQSKNRQVMAFEALLRWDFDGENVPPDEFIPIAERYGLINDIGCWVLQQSCNAAAKWLSNYPDHQPSVSVNVSVLQLHDIRFIEIVESALATSQLAAEKLTIEITESIFSNEKDTILKCIKILKIMGVQVSIDDFGTEYSSLSVIQDLAANTIKIDRSFINKFNTSGLAIIEAVKQMAVKLDYTVVAEGVETQEQAEQLSALGIEMLQGYYFARPLELNNVAGYLEQQKPDEIFTQ